MPISSFTRLVTKASWIERLVDFCRSLGFTFEQHQHGVGPVHFAGTIGDVVFEIYPGTKSLSETTNVRFGFSTGALECLMREVNQAGGTILSGPVESPWALGAVIADPDGNKVEFSQRNN